MQGTERDFIVFAVKRLFDKIKRGQVHFANTVPQTLAEVKAVRFDENGEPIYESIGPLVRAMARGIVGHDLEREAEERIRTSPVHSYLGEPVAVNDDILRECASKSSFSPLAFELYKETVTVLAVCSHAHTGQTPEDCVLPRNQAICAGLLVRIAKFMTAVASLVSQDSERGDVVFALNRSITESATNLRFLVLKNEDRFFDQFVRFSLAPERELYDLIQQNITERGGEILPIEERMLKSIEQVCRLSGVAITDVAPKMGDCGGGLRNRLIALGQGETYVAQQRGPSHAVHGTWVDLVQHHLTAVEGGFQPDPTWSRVDSRLMLPACVLVLAAAHAYVDAFFPPLPELEPLFKRMVDLEQRIRAVDRAHEAWFNSRKSEDDP
jgi:hypothetical protein